MGAFDSPVTAALVTLLGSYLIAQFGATQSKKEKDKIEKLEHKIEKLEKGVK